MLDLRSDGHDAMNLRLETLSPDERYAAWRRVIERIYHDQVSQAWNHYLFRLLRAIFVKNPRLSEEGGFVFQWMVENYVDAALMLIRRELDKQAGTENLRNLLSAMIQYPTVLTRARYRAAWNPQGPVEQQHAERSFNSFNPKRVDGENDYIDPAVIQSDLDRVVASAEQLRQYAERTRAHRTPSQKIDLASITFAAMHEAIAGVRDVVAKYYALITLDDIVGRWEPDPKYDTLEPFMKAWIVDRVLIEEALRERGK